VTVSHPLKAPLVEVFASIQGEGRFVGRPMAFLRVAVCPLRCRYCDTPNSYVAATDFPVTIGDRRLTEPNPVTGARAAELALEAARHSVFGATGSDTTSDTAVDTMVAVTGGEPLLYPGFVRAVGDVLHSAGARLLLETAALDADALASCLDVVDHLSADYKLPETLAAEDRDPGMENVRCAELAVARGISTDVKIVLTPGVADASLRLALERLGPVRQHIALILQPVTPFGRETEPLQRGRLLAFTRLACQAGFAPLVIPQIHKLLHLP